MPTDRRVVVLGATGHFGRRICARLVGEPLVELILSSRDQARTDEFARQLQQAHPDASVRAHALDQRGPDFARQLAHLRPTLVLHTAGPYQGQDYGVAAACLDCGSHYIDLADGREFVSGFSRLDEAARSRDVLLISGASTLPGLTSTVIDALLPRFAAVESITMSVAPANRTPRGLGTVEAVLSYCGRAVPVLVDGRWQTRYGWQDLRIQRYPGLAPRLSAVCDVPDLALLPERIPECRTVLFHAALEAPWEQLALWLMAWPVRAGMVESWRRCAPALQRLSTVLSRLGSDRGAMHVRMTGRDGQGNPRCATWFLLAGRNHGPEIPCSPALLLTRKLLRGEMTRRGAMPCLGMFDLSDFAAEISAFDVSWRIEEGPTR